VGVCTPRKNQLTVVISDAEDFLKHERDTFVGNIARQIRKQVQQHTRTTTTMPAVTAHRLIVENGLRLVLRQGWRDHLIRRLGRGSRWLGTGPSTGYPAVLEGAVRSGQRAATALLDQLSAAK